MSDIKILAIANSIFYLIPSWLAWEEIKSTYDGLLKDNL